MAASAASAASTSSGPKVVRTREGMDGVEKRPASGAKKKPDQARNALLTCIPSIKARNQARTRRYN